MQDKMKNLMIGIFTITALAIVVFMVIFLHPYTGNEGQHLRIRFTDIDKVNIGTRVSFAGKAVGEIVKIQILDEIRRGRTEHNGGVYVYELTAAVDSSLKVYNTDVISLRTSGLLGEKSISIEPEPLKPGQELRVVNDEILYAEGTGSVEDTFNEFKEVADRFDVALDLVIDFLHELQERHVWENVGNIAENLSELSTRFNSKWPEMENTINDIAELAANTKDISEKVKDGEGTIGKLFSTDDLYLRTASLFNKGETVLDDMNHYGLLYHLDKGWQRLRARRLNLLHKLKTPQEFRNYFSDEMNQISTSLSRVSMVLEQSESYPSLMEDREYQKVFSELLRRVETLEEALKMYNIQVVDKEVQKTELLSGRS